jgi:adenylate kinase
LQTAKRKLPIANCPKQNNIMINIVLFGPPGSGKGTQAQNLIEKFNLKQISTGDLFRFNMKNDTDLGKLAKSFIDKGELVPDQVTTDMLIDEIRKPSDAAGFIFDGYPRTAVQTEALEKIVKEELNDNIDICLSLVVEDAILVERLLKRGEISGRSDDGNVEIIENRIKEYYAKTAEVAELYKQQGKYVEINGVGEINEISEKLFAEVEKVK